MVPLEDVVLRAVELLRLILGLCACFLFARIILGADHEMYEFLCLLCVLFWLVFLL